MSERLTNLLGYLTLFAILGAIWVLFGEDPTREQGGRGEPTFDGMKASINDVANVALSSGDGTVTLSKEGEAWVVAERSGYPANAEKVRSFLKGIAVSERREPKTANMDRFEQIGLGDKAVKVSLAGQDGAPMLTFDMGKRSAIGADRSLTYVWQKSDTRSWLVTGLGDAQVDPAAWLKTGLLTLSEARVRSVELGTLQLVRGLGETDFTLAPLGKNEKAAAPWRLGEAARVLSGLSFDDVRRLGNPLSDPRAKVVMTTHDGLVVSLVLYDMEGATWAQVSAQFDSATQSKGEAGTLPDAPADGAAEAVAINDQARGWFFRLSDADAGVLLQTKADLTEAQG